MTSIRHEGKRKGESRPFLIPPLAGDKINTDI